VPETQETAVNVLRQIWRVICANTAPKKAHQVAMMGHDYVLN
jgi:hypothetical protein